MICMYRGGLAEVIHMAHSRPIEGLQVWLDISWRLIEEDRGRWAVT